MIKVPHCLILFSREAHTDELDPIFQSHPEVFGADAYGCEEAKLCAFMIRGMKLPDFKWRPFLDCRGHNENLADWSDAELIQLQDEETYDDIKKKQYTIHEIWTLWHAALSQSPELYDPEDITEESFNEYWKYIENRSFGFAWPLIALVPVAEFINHSMCGSYYSYDTGYETLSEPSYDYFEADEDVDELFYEEDFLLPINCADIVTILEHKWPSAAILKEHAASVDESENDYSQA